MPREYKQLTYRRIQLAVGLLLAGVLYSQFGLSNDQVVISPRTPVVLAAESLTAEPFEHLVRQDPLKALIAARERHVREVSDYQCTLVKQESLPSGMSAEQEIDVKFRQQPYSVMFHWTRNAGLAERVIYVKGRWVDEKASDPQERDLAVCQPGVVARVFVKSVKQPIHGRMAKKNSRRYLDEFGFGRALDLLIEYSQLAERNGDLDLRFAGESHFDGRPVWVIERHLPYSGAGGVYPDRTAEVLIDKEYRLPVAVYSYSDDDKSPQSLLGKYEYRNIKLPAGLSDRDFDPAFYGM